jgi:hypothetical protein
MTRFGSPSLILAAAIGCAAATPTAAAAPPPASAAPPNAAPAPAPAPAKPAPAKPAPAKPAALRTPEAILADAVQAMGGAAAWNAHKNMHVKMETTLQGMGIGGSGERFSTSTDKSLTTMEMVGIGRVREGNNGKVAWTEEAAHGLRYLEGAEAEQARIGSVWNLEMRARELFTKLESASDTGPDGAPLECIVATPKLSPPLRTCYDPRTHLQVTQSGVHPGPEGDMPFRQIIRAWKDFGGIKMPSESNTQLGPITTVDRILSVTFDEPIDDKMFDPPQLAAPPGSKAKPPKRKSK